ncbi:MAG: FtsX-like permease family protein [Bacteroidaceae bacterium]
MNLSFFIARRLYYSKKDTKQVSRPAVRIGTIGIVIGLSVMILSLCTVLGFKREISSKVIGFGQHIEIMNQRSLGSPTTLPIDAPQPFLHKISNVEGIEHVQRFSQKMGMLKTDNDFQGVMLKGIAKEYNLNFLRSHLLEGEIPEFSANSSTNKILISKTIADALHLKIGSRVFSYFFEESIKTRRFTVCGIYQTNMQQFDKSFVITDLRTVNKLNHWKDDQCSGLELQITDYEHQLDQTDMQVIKALSGIYMQNNDTYIALTIRELYPQIFNWLDLLDMNVWVILTLMICLSGFTMISGLLILILERTSTIGVLKALGAQNRTIRHIFLHFATFIIGKGLLWGNIIGLGLALLQNYFHILKLDASNYYVESVPIEFNIPILIALNVATFVIALLSLIAPSFLISHIQPAKALRFD